MSEWHRWTNAQGKEIVTHTTQLVEGIVMEVFEKVVEIEHRTNCFCCTCGDQPPSDPHCRNHGIDGERPCDIHGMPGFVDSSGEMPLPVLAYRESLKRRKSE